MREKNLSKIFWTEALTGGLVMGLAFFILELIGYAASSYNSRLASFGFLIVLVAGIYYFCQRMRAFRGPVAGFPYASVFGFIVAMMMFAGMIYGIGTFFLHFVIAPGYYMEQLETQMYASGLYTDSLVEQSMEVLLVVPKLFLLVVYAVVFAIGMVLYGGVIGLIVAAFIKRPADPFAETDGDEYNPTF